MVVWVDWDVQKLETSLHAGACTYDEWKMKTKHYSLLFYLCFIK